MGAEITNNILTDIYDYLSEVCSIPYFFDLLHYENISNEKLKRHINDYGKVIYEKTMNEKNRLCRYFCWQPQSCFPRKRVSPTATNLS